MAGSLLCAKPVYELREYLFSVEDQIDFQRLGGVCAKQPYSCYFCFVLSVLRRTFGLGNRIADVTYGFGSFYVACRREYEIHGVDVVRREWMVEPDKFYQCDCTQEACYRQLPRNYFDFLVVDPPYATRPTSRTRANDRLSQLYEGREGFERVMRAVPRLARYLLKPNGLVIVKGMDLQVKFEIDKTHNVWYWLNYYWTCGLKPYTILYYRSRAFRRVYSGRNPLVKNYSWLLVLRV